MPTKVDTYILIKDIVIAKEDEEMLDQIIELAEHRVPITYSSLKNSFNEVLALKETYNSTIYYYSNDNLGWIRGKINNHEIRIVFIRIPEADENEEVKDNDTIEILRIFDCNLAKTMYNSDVYKGDALL